MSDQKLRHQFTHNGSQVFSACQVGAMVGVSARLIRYYDSLSEKLEAAGKPRLIPRPVLSDQFERRGLFTDRVKTWTATDVEEIRRFRQTKRHGEMAGLIREVSGAGA